MPRRRMAAFHLDSRHTKAAFSDRHCLAIARPRWRGEAEKAQRLVAERSELERHPCRDDDRRAFGHAPGFTAGPHLAHTGQEVPDLFHGSMLLRPAHASGAKHHLDQARALRTQLAKVDLCAVGRDRVGLQLFHTGFRFSTNAEMPSWPSGATALREIASAIIS